MKHIHITNARRQPFIGPKPSPVPAQVGIALAVVTGAFVVSYAIAWLACELKNLH